MTQPKMLGRIEWKDDHGGKHWAEFSANTSPWGISHGLPYELHLGSDLISPRSIDLLKTRVKIAVDENADGTPLLETWVCKVVWFGEQ